MSGYSAPTCVPWTSPDPNKLDVTVCSNGSAKHSIDAYTVVTYEAMIGFRFCTIIPAVPELKSCQLSELDAGTKYHVLVKALNKLAGVSSSASSIAMTTIPDGRHYQQPELLLIVVLVFVVVAVEVVVIVAVALVVVLVVAVGIGI